MRNILTIAKRELASYLNTPTAYIITVAFLTPSYFLFWRQVLIANDASLRGFFSLLPWFLLLFIPALTMKALSEEKNKNTIELLLTHAIQEWHIIMGKFLGTLAFYLLILITTFSLPITLLRYSNPDLGIIIGQYIGAIFLGAAMIAMGILVSTWFSQTITAFLSAAGINFLWILLGLDLVTLALPWPFNQIVHQLSLLTHSDQLARGLIELRDVSYFVITTSVLLALAAIKLSHAKLVENRAKQTRMYTGAILIIVLGVVSHLFFTNFPQRIDLTSNQRFTLSQGTIDTLNQLPDIVSINFYASQNLPAQVQTVKQDVQDTLKDYVRYGNNKLKVNTLHPDTDPQIAQKAAEEGIQQIQFNTIASGKFSVEQGHMGIVVRYGSQTEVIPFIQNAGTLEYDLTQRIRKLTVQNQPTIGFLSGLGVKSNFTDLSSWNTEIQTQYQTTTVSLDTEDSSVDADVLVIAGPRESATEATASAKVKDYLDNNHGKVLFLLDSVEANTQLGIASPVEHGWGPILSDYGLTQNQNLAYDAQLNENIQVGQGLIRYILPYPFWVRSLPDPTGAQTIEIPEGVLLGWPSSVITTETDGVKITPLLTTSQAGGIMEGALTIAPDTAPKEGQGKPILLSAIAEKNGSRLALISDSDIATNNFYENSPANQVFLANILDWLIADETLARIPRRQTVPAILQFNNQKDPMIAQYGNVIGIPVLVGLFGFYWLKRRHKLTERKYRS